MGTNSADCFMWDGRNARYERRIIGYVDVLGWRDACKLFDVNDLLRVVMGIKDHAASFSKEAKNSLRDAGTNYSNIREQRAIEFSFFSDNFAVSAPATKQHAANIFKILGWACHELLKKKFAARGAITLGDLYHEDDIIFGPALSEAVDIEQNRACYPRILCTDTLMEFLSPINNKIEGLVRDQHRNWVVNWAFGAPQFVLPELDSIVKDKIACSSKSLEKWMYLQQILPVMYASRRSL